MEQWVLRELLDPKVYKDLLDHRVPKEFKVLAV
jgi:hypothetical protein